ncbi:MAG: ABC transporter permease [Micromonosporaceae bacterium]
MTVVTPATAGWPGTVAERAAAAGRIVGNEVVKGLRILWSHKAALIPQLAVLGVMYLMFQLILGGGRLVPALLPVTLFAYVVYVVNYIALLKIVAGLLEEVNTGTLEQAHLSPLRPWSMVAGRLLAVLIEGVASALLVGAVFVVALGIDIPWRAAAVVPLLLTLADIAGFALLLAGIALVVASIGAIVHVINSMIMMINGALVPITAFPPGLELAAKFVPTTLGIDVSRKALFDGAPVTALVADGSLGAAALHAAVMLAVGWAVYRWAVRVGLRDGRLGP